MKAELSKSKIYFIQSLAARLWVCVTDHVDVILPRALTAGITSSIDTGPYISDSLQLLNLELPSTWYPVGTTGRRWQWSYTGVKRLRWGQFLWVLDSVYAWYYYGRWSEVGLDLRRWKVKGRVGEDFCKNCPAPRTLEWDIICGWVIGRF